MTERSVGSGNAATVAARAAHLAARFVGSLVPRRVSEAQAQRVRAQLTEAEYACWERMPRADRIEGLAVARRFEKLLAAARSHYDESLVDTCIAAALVHDVGKQDAGLGTYRRALATIAGAVAGHDMADAWSLSRGVTRRFGLYLQHAELGRQRLVVSGGRPDVAQWAAVHHTPSQWSSTGWPRPLCEMLARADGEVIPRTSSQDS